jgi:DNA-binding transcriptional LysR family regulator
LDNLGSFKVFVRAAETRSFTEAGNMLGLSSSAVSKAIARLEHRLGVRLFRRSTRSITLTDEGISFLESCRRIFAEMEAIESGFAEAKGQPRGRLRVSMPMVGMLMLPAIGGFIRAYSEVQLDLDFSDRLVDVVNDGYDVVVRTGESVDSRLIARSLGSYRLEVVGSPAYFKRMGIPKEPADLLNHVCLHHRYPTSGKLQRWPFRTAPGTPDIALPIGTISSTVEPLLSLAEAGLGMTCIPDFAVRKQIADGTLVRVLEKFIEHEGVWRAVWPASPFLSPKLRVFVDYLAANLLSTSKPVAKRRS